MRFRAVIDSVGTYYDNVYPPESIKSYVDKAEGKSFPVYMDFDTSKPPIAVASELKFDGEKCTALIESEVDLKKLMKELEASFSVAFSRVEANLGDTVLHYININDKAFNKDWQITEVIVEDVKDE